MKVVQNYSTLHLQQLTLKYIFTRVNGKVVTASKQRNNRYFYRKGVWGEGLEGLRGWFLKSIEK